MYNKENMICSFCVNEYHLAVIIIPYIYNAMNEKKKIITFFDRGIRDISMKVINTNELFWKNKNVFSDINWDKVKFEKLAQKFENVQDNDIVIVAGKDDFIERINRLLINFHTNFTLVNCYNVKDIAKNDNFKISNYGKLLNTKGLVEIENINFV